MQISTLAVALVFESRRKMEEKAVQVQGKGWECWDPTSVMVGRWILMNIMNVGDTSRATCMMVSYRLPFFPPSPSCFTFYTWYLSGEDVIGTWMLPAEALCFKLVSRRRLTSFSNIFVPSLRITVWGELPSSLFNENASENVFIFIFTRTGWGLGARIPVLDSNLEVSNWLIQIQRLKQAKRWQNKQTKTPMVCGKNFAWRPLHCMGFTTDVLCVY